MFKHQVQMQLRADTFTLLSRKIENTIMPLLRQQKGFCDGITFVAPERSTATGDTFWNTEADAEAYQKNGFQKVLETISEVLTETPTVSITKVSGQDLRIKNG